MSASQFISTLSFLTQVPNDFEDPNHPILLTPKPKQPKGTKEPEPPKLTPWPAPKSTNFVDLSFGPPNAKGINEQWTQSEIILTVIQSCAFLLCVLPMIIFVFLYFKKDKRVANKRNSLKLSFIFLMLCCLCFAMTSMLSLINSIFLEQRIYEYDKNSADYNSIQIPLQIIWIIARTLMYIFFVMRLHFVYKDSMYEYSHTFITSLILIISVFALFQISTKVLNHTSYLSIFQTPYLSILMLIKDIVTSMFLLYLFTRVLLKLIVRQSESKMKEHCRTMSTSFGGMEENESNKMEHRKCSPFHEKFKIVSTVMNGKYSKSEDMLQTVTKITILSCVALVSTIMALCAENVLSKTIKYHILFDHILLGIFSIDSAINSICIYLSFIFAKKHYNYLCGHCDKLCVKCCKCVANVKVSRSKEIRSEIEEICAQSQTVLKMGENSSFNSSKKHSPQYSGVEFGRNNNNSGSDKIADLYASDSSEIP